jgi:hypothetical protein
MDWLFSTVENWALEEWFFCTWVIFTLLYTLVGCFRVLRREDPYEEGPLYLCLAILCWPALIRDP